MGTIDCTSCYLDQHSASMTPTLEDGRRLILASTSPFRCELLRRLCLPFEIQAPDIDEMPLANEQAQPLVGRLAAAKACAIACKNTKSLVIGSDQVAVLDGKILGKPGHHEQASEQLLQASGRRVAFYTGIALIDSDSRRSQVAVVTFHVHFRELSSRQIESYLQREQPYQCAGSFKAEGLGIALFDRLEGDDPSSLIGLPLIRLTRMLEIEGVAVL